MGNVSHRQFDSLPATLEFHMLELIDMADSDAYWLYPTTNQLFATHQKCTEDHLPLLAVLEQRCEVLSTLRSGDLIDLVS